MITVVTGLPRSGTSVLMQMLAAGGLAPLTDGERAADESNPRGYLEWEAAKQLPRDPAAIVRAEGKAVKIVAPLLASLPAGPEYRLLFIKRDEREVARSQAAMLARSGTAPALPPAAMERALAATLRRTEDWLARQAHLPALAVAHADLLRAPLAEARRMIAFLGLPLDAHAMAACVDPRLHRQRAGGE